MSKLFAIGDIQGRRDKLDRLLDRLPLQAERDALVFLGDYLNRDGQSRQALDRLLAVERRGRRRTGRTQEGGAALRRGFPAARVRRPGAVWPGRAWRRPGRG